MILGRTGRIISDGVVFFLTTLAWLLVFIVPKSGNYWVFTGEPTQYALLAILLSILVLSLLAGADRLNLRTVPVLLGLLLLDVICGKYIWQIASWLVAQAGHDTVVMLYLDTIGCVAAAFLFGACMGRGYGLCVLPHSLNLGSGHAAVLGFEHYGRVLRR